jgi:hypothetical protein
MSLGEDLILYHAVILGKIKVTIRIAQNTGLQQPTFSPAYKVSRWNFSRLWSEVYHNLPQPSSEATSAKSLTKSPIAQSCLRHRPTLCTRSRRATVVALEAVSLATPCILVLKIPSGQWLL